MNNVRKNIRVALTMYITYQFLEIACCQKSDAIFEIGRFNWPKKSSIVADLKYDVIVIQMHHHTRQTNQ